MGFLLGPSAAFGCSLLTPEPLFGDPDPNDVVAPLPALVEAVDVFRGAGPRVPGEPRTSCDDLGWVTLRVRQPEQEAEGEIGYLLELAAGSVPNGMALPDVPWKGQTLVLAWLDVDEQRRQPISFELLVTAVDPAGNRSAPVLVSVSDLQPCGCNTSGFTSMVPLWLLLALLHLKRRWFEP